MAKKVMIPKKQVHHPEHGIGVISLILGICGLGLFSWTFPLLGAMFGLIAWILGNFGEKHNQRFSEAGMYIGVIAVFISLAVWILGFLFLEIILMI